MWIRRWVLLILALIGVSEKVNAQSILDFNYEIVLTSDSVVVDSFMIDLPVHRVVILQDSNELEDFKNYNSTELLKLVSEREESYRACLLLYAIHNRDAEIFLSVKEDEWYLERLDVELAYWTQVLKN